MNFIQKQGAPLVVPVILTMPVDDVSIQLTANLAYSIRKPPPRGRFDLNHSMVQIVNSNRKFDVLPMRIGISTLGTPWILLMHTSRLQSHRTMRG